MHNLDMVDNTGALHAGSLHTLAQPSTVILNVGMYTTCWQRNPAPKVKGHKPHTETPQLYS